MYKGYTHFLNGLPAMTVRAAGRTIPRKIRHFRKHVSVNGHINWRAVVKPGVTSAWYLMKDYPQRKTILIGNGKLVRKRTLPRPTPHHASINLRVWKPHANEPRELALLNHVSYMSVRPAYVVHRLDKKPASSLPGASYTPYQSTAGKARNQPRNIEWFKAKVPSKTDL